MQFTELYNKLQNAYEESTLSNNRFAQLIAEINWDEQLFTDGEFYFVKDGHIFTTPSLNPFDMPYSPNITASDFSGTLDIKSF